MIHRYRASRLIVKDMKWGAKRLQDLQRYIHDNIDAVLKSQVPIWEFMKCLHVECGIDYPALTAYEKQFGPVDIYRGNRGERQKNMTERYILQFPRGVAVSIFPYDTAYLIDG